MTQKLKSESDTFRCPLNESRNVGNDPKLLEKPQVIAANKMDAVYGDEKEIVQSLRQEFEKDGIRVFPISAVSGKGLKELL